MRTSALRSDSVRRGRRRRRGKRAQRVRALHARLQAESARADAADVRAMGMHREGREVQRALEASRAAEQRAREAEGRLDEERAWL